MTDAQVETLLGEVTGDGSGETSLAADFRISIASAQEKTALLRVGRRWASMWPPPTAMPRTFPFFWSVAVAFT